MTVYQRARLERLARTVATGLAAEATKALEEGLAVAGQQTFMPFIVRAQRATRPPRQRRGEVKNTKRRPRR